MRALLKCALAMRLSCLLESAWRRAAAIWSVSSWIVGRVGTGPQFRFRTGQGKVGMAGNVTLFRLIVAGAGVVKAGQGES